MAVTESTDAEWTLSEVDRVRRGTRRALHPIWFSNLVTGVFFLGAALLSAVDGGGIPTAVYWAAGGAATLALIVRHDVHGERELGVESRAWDPAVGIVAAMIAGIVGANALIDGDTAGVVALYPAATGTLALGALLRDRVEAVAGAVLAVLATALLAADPSDPWTWAALGLGLTMAGAGLAGRARAAA
jgi:hypothetical protein